MQLLGGLGFILTPELPCVLIPAARMSPQPCPQVNAWLEPGWKDTSCGCFPLLSPKGDLSPCFLLVLSETGGWQHPSYMEKAGRRHEGFK